MAESALCRVDLRLGLSGRLLEFPSRQVPPLPFLDGLPETVLSRVTAIYRSTDSTMPLATLISSIVSPHACATAQRIQDYLLTPSYLLNYIIPTPTTTVRWDPPQPQMYLQICRGMVRPGTSASTEVVASMAALCAWKGEGRGEGCEDAALQIRETGLSKVLLAIFLVEDDSYSIYLLVGSSIAVDKSAPTRRQGLQGRD
jgi:hypothetical protein